MNFNLSTIFALTYLLCTLNETSQSILNRDTLAKWIPNYNTASKLDLFAKQITAISPQTFAQLENVIALYLNQNQLAYVSSYTFDGLVNLVRLSLSQTCIMTHLIICLI